MWTIELRLKYRIALSKRNVPAYFRCVKSIFQIYCPDAKYLAHAKTKGIFDHRYLLKVKFEMKCEGEFSVFTLL